MRNRFALMLVFMAGTLVAQTVDRGIPKVVVYDPNNSRGPAIIYSSDPCDVQVWYDTFVRPMVEAQITDSIVDVNVIYANVQTKIDSAVTAAELRMWQKMVDADGNNLVLAQQTMLSRVKAKIDELLSEMQ